MVSFKPKGRLGNFLFEAATAFAYAKRHKLSFSIPLTTKDKVWHPIYLEHLQDNNYNELEAFYVLREEQHEYKEIPFIDTWATNGVNILIHGYRQSEKYFSDYRKEILEAFRIPYIENKNVVSVHIRRGDYLLYPGKHPVVTERYLNEAIAHFVWQGFKNFKFHSDDMEWTKNYKPPYNIQIEYSENKSPMDDLISMSGCEHQICSNSTLAWWGWWLNQNEKKQVIMPKIWFGIDNKHLETRDIYPKNCIKL